MTPEDLANRILRASGTDLRDYESQAYKRHILETAQSIIDELLQKEQQLPNSNGDLENEY